ncbi:hypothetical protein C7U60_03985 [Mesorhizobium plurifarium]|nr:hypothetical protein C7U60_03985 [Mesorhizobium plurifarium]
MNPHEELREKPPLDPATGQPTPRDPETPVVRSRRSTWPLLVIILAGLILALIAWLPAELTRDAENEPVAPSQSETTAPDTTPGQPAPTDQATPPAGGTTAPAAPETQTPAAPETQPPAAPATPAQPQTTPAQ